MLWLDVGLANHLRDPLSTSDAYPAVEGRNSFALINDALGSGPYRGAPHPDLLANCGFDSVG